MLFYPDVERLIQQHATEEGKALLARPQTMTTAAAVGGLRNKDINNYIDLSLDEMWDLPEVKHVVETMKLGTAHTESS